MSNNNPRQKMKKRINLSLSPETQDMLRQLADTQDISKSAVITSLIRRAYTTTSKANKPPGTYTYKSGL